MPESGSTIPLVNVTTSGGYGASVPTYVASTSSGAFAGVPVVNVTTSGGLGAASLSVTSTATQISNIPTVVVATSAGLTQTLVVTSTSVQISNIPTVVVTTSAGAVIFSALQVSPTSSVAGAGYAIVTSSYGQLVALSTAGGAFSGVPLVGVSSSSTALINLVTSGGTIVPVTTGSGLLVLLSSAGLTQISGPVLLSTASGFGAIGTIRSLSSGTVSTLSSGAIVLSSAGLTQISGVPKVVVTTSAGITPALVVVTTVQAIKTAATVLQYISGFTTAPTGALIRLYNATTSNVSMGASVLAAFLVGSQSSATPFGGQNTFGPLGMSFGTACSVDCVLTATSTATVASQCFVTVLAQ